MLGLVAALVVGLGLVVGYALVVGLGLGLVVAELDFAHGQQHITRTYRPCVHTVSNTVLFKDSSSTKSYRLHDFVIVIKTQEKG